MAEVEQAVWDRLAAPLETPFLEWGWLSALEESGSIAAPHGWHPRHVTLWRGSRLVAAAPLYIKEHSEGELIFDYAWADAAYQVGAEYYPKLVGMSPATPSPAYRFLIDSQEDRDEITARLLEEIEALCRRERLAGVHFQHIEPSWAAELGNAGFHRWTHQGYQWRNRGFSSFDDYLACFNKNQRRNIRRERASVHEAGITVKTITGEAISADLLDTMSRYYEAHNAQFGPWAAKFLNRRFFLELESRYRSRIVLIAAYRDGTLEAPGAPRAHLEPGTVVDPRAGAGPADAGMGARAGNEGRAGADGLALREGAGVSSHAGAGRAGAAAGAGTEGRAGADAGGGVFGPQPIAMSFLVAKGERLVGRYWGAAEWHDNLHFELCYYAPIAYAIETGRRSFDPGIGSAHKLRRGFEAVELASLHKFRDPRMQTVVSVNIGRINALQRQQIALMNEHIPFKKHAR